MTPADGDVHDGDAGGGRPEARAASRTAGAPAPAPGPVLVLGGTAWLGRLVAERLRDRGHAVTVLARGRSGVPPEGVEVVTADRDDPRGLDAVRDRAWSTVVELTSTPAHARAAAAALGTRTEHVVVVSSVSVYADATVVGADKRAETVAPADDEGYAAAKVAVEDAWRSAGSTTVLRAGLLGGPGDESGRSGWWPWRFAQGGAVPVPAERTSTQLLDVRDLADFVADLAAQEPKGVLDVVGPVVPLDEVLRTAATVAGDDAARIVLVPTRDLVAAGVQPWAGPCSLPMWVPGADHAGFASRSGAAARASGLVTRSLDGTLRDCLAWERRRGDQPRGAGLTRDDERRVLGTGGATTVTTDGRAASADRERGPA